VPNHQQTNESQNNMQKMKKKLAFPDSISSETMHMRNGILCKDDRSIFFLNMVLRLASFWGRVILMNWVLFQGIHPLNSPALLLLELFPFRVEHPYSTCHTTRKGPLKSSSFRIPRKSTSSLSCES
jgi:hypothetical protein